MQDDLLVNVEVLHSIVAVIVGKGEGDAMAADQCACVCMWKVVLGAISLDTNSIAQTRYSLCHQCQ